MEIELNEPWLRIDLGRPHDTVGWTLIGGGIHQTTCIVWREIQDGDLTLGVDPVDWVRTRLGPEDRDAVVFLTSRNVARFEHERSESPAFVADVICTLGLSNGMDLTRPVGPSARASDAPGRGAEYGTINILCRIDQPITLVARLELLALVVEARTTALIDATSMAGSSESRVTGTGTDCVVIASSQGPRAPLAYGGKHTQLGRAVVETVYIATRRACNVWLAEQT